MTQTLSTLAQSFPELETAIRSVNYVRSAELPEASRTTVAVEGARVKPDREVDEAADALVIACCELAKAIGDCGPTLDGASAEEVAPQREEALRKLKTLRRLHGKAEPNELAQLLAAASRDAAG